MQAVLMSIAVLAAPAAAGPAFEALQRAEAASAAAVNAGSPRQAHALTSTVMDGSTPPAGHHPPTAGFKPGSRVEDALRSRQAPRRPEAPKPSVTTESRDKKNSTMDGWGMVFAGAAWAGVGLLLLSGPLGAAAVGLGALIAVIGIGKLIGGLF